MTDSPLPHGSPSVDLDDVDGTVLVVDDDEDLTDTYALWLEDALTVETAYDGLEALSTLSDRAVDAVVLDRRMPSVSGDDVLQTVRERGDDVPVALASAVEPTIDVLDLAFDEYLVKPVGRRSMRSTVANLLTLTDQAPAVREYTRLRAARNVLAAGPRYRDDETALAHLRDRVDRQRERARAATSDTALDGSDPARQSQVHDQH